MVDPWWTVKTKGSNAIPSILAHSTLDPAIVDAIVAGNLPFPDYADIPLRPARQLLHEVIVQAVTDRRMPGLTYEERLHALVNDTIRTPAYTSMQERGAFDAMEVSALLDAAGTEYLTSVAPDERLTVMMATGGPATGKTELVKSLARVNPDIVGNAAVVNSDHYKLLLASEAEYGAAYADIAHDESAFVADRILARLADKIEAGLAPHTVLDIVTVSDARMALAKDADRFIVAVGTLSPEEALKRSYERGLETRRKVSTEVVLAGARAVAETVPRVFDHPNLEMRLYDTDVPRGDPHKLVAEYDPSIRTLQIRDPDVFIDFAERRNLNPKATGPDELFRADHRSPAAIAEGLNAYTDKDVTLAFQNPQGEIAIAIGPQGVRERSPLNSRRGEGFFAALAAATGARRAASVPAPETTDASRSVVNRAVGAAGAGLGVYGLVSGAERYGEDLAAGGTAAAASGGSIMANAGAIAADLAGHGWKAGGLGFLASALDSYSALAKGDGYALASTGGSVLGSVAGASAGAWLGKNAGGAWGAAGGGLLGAVGGAYGGGTMAEYAAGDAVQAWMDDQMRDRRAGSIKEIRAIAARVDNGELLRDADMARLSELRAEFQTDLAYTTTRRDSIPATDGAAHQRQAEAAEAVQAVIAGLDTLIQTGPVDLAESRADLIGGDDLTGSAAFTAVYDALPSPAQATAMGLDATMRDLATLKQRIEAGGPDAYRAQQDYAALYDQAAAEPQERQVIRNVIAYGAEGFRHRAPAQVSPEPSPPPADPAPSQPAPPPDPMAQALAGIDLSAMRAILGAPQDAAEAAGELAAPSTYAVAKGNAPEARTQGGRY